MTEEFEKVVGVTFDNRQEIIRGLKKADKLNFVREPENKYDPNAIRVECAGQMIGYVKKDGWLSKMILEGTTPKAEVYQVTGGFSPSSSRGVIMKVSY